MRKLLQNTIIVMLLSSIVACGGGGGSSGGATAVVPPPPPPQNTTFPTSFTNTLPENSSDFYIEQTFKYNAPSDNPPTNLNVSGPDADLFEVLIEATAADSNGDRDVTVTVRNSGTAAVPFQRNFEFPQDANKDNVYEFSFSGTYENRNISSDVTITITDVLDQAESAGRFYVGNPGEVGFGGIFISVPDITGDGKAELSLISRGVSSGDKGFIIASENMDGGAETVSMSDTANHIVQFIEQSPVPEPSQSTSRDDVLSARENADGSVDILIGRGQLNNATIFHIPQAGRNGSFMGDKTLGVASMSSYVLDFSDIGRDYYARLIDDVNGDGKSDIFLQSDGLPNRGIIFGNDSKLNSEGMASFDIELQQPSDFGTTNLEPLSFKKLPDLTGDGIEDFMIVRVKRVTFLSGAALQLGTISSLNLDNLTADQGFSISDIDTFYRLADVITAPDFDGDGFPTLIFITKEAGGSGISLPVMDADDFMALADNPSNDNFQNSLRSIGPNSGTYQEALLTVGDRTGDGVVDILVFNGSFGNTIELVSGTVIRDALDSTAPSNQVFQVSSDDAFKVEIERFNGDTSTTSAQPVWFPEADLIAFGSVCGNELANMPCAGVGLLRAEDINAAIESSAPSLKFRSVEGLPF